MCHDAANEPLLYTFLFELTYGLLQVGHVPNIIEQDMA